MRPHHHDALAVIARSDDDYRDAVIIRAVGVIVGTRVSMVIRPADHDLPVEIGIAETERNPNARLGLRDASREAKQQCENDEYPFHGYLLSAPVHKEEACQAGVVCNVL